MEKEKEKKETRSESTESDSGGGAVTSSSSSSEEEEVEKLEEEIGEMAEKLYELRSTFPSHLNSTLSSLFSTQPQLLSLSSSDLQQQQQQATPSGDANVVLSADDGETVDEIQLLREKISSNITAMPGVLKRMKDCISRLDKLVSSNETIHPAFKRKKI